MIITKLTPSCACDGKQKSRSMKLHHRSRSMKLHHLTQAGTNKWLTVVFVCDNCRSSHVIVFGKPPQDILERP